MATEPLIFDLSSPDAWASRCLKWIWTKRLNWMRRYLRGELDLPEVSEIDMTRHFTRLSQKNYSIDTGFYPLGRAR